MIDQEEKKNWDWDQLIEKDVECELEIIGVSAVDDLLQEGVARCIVDFKGAGIKVWMLTGDKGLTAKMIGIKCGLIPSSSINSDSELNSPSILIQIAPSFIHEEISKSIH